MVIFHSYVSLPEGIFKQTKISDVKNPTTSATTKSARYPSIVSIFLGWKFPVQMEKKTANQITMEYTLRTSQNSKNNTKLEQTIIDIVMTIRNQNICIQ
jgi:hypothetical protein